MSVICALSNEVPEVPVVSPVSGSIFEKRLIIKYLEENGHTDPINGEALREDQLIELKVPSVVKPKPPTYTSIPVILKSLQDEWDAVMLNSFTVRKQLLVARQELSHSLYQHDAACRVIARLNNELSAAREALATLKPQNDLPTNGHQNERNEPNNSDEINDPEFIQRLEANAQQLTNVRKRRTRKLPEDLTNAEQMKQFSTINSFNVHQPTPPGILCLDISPSNELLLTGGNDKLAIVFNKATETIQHRLAGHAKKVSSVIWHPNSVNVITASSDATIRVWNLENEKEEIQTPQITLQPHNGPITAISLHPLNNYLLSASTDELWAFSDITTGKCLLKLGDTNTEHALTTAQFHPDGMILGCGASDSLIKIWDLKDRKNVAVFEGHVGQIRALKFSENGFLLATAAEDGVKVWDLRKLQIFKTIQFEPEYYPINQISFDNSGYYMAVAGNDLRIYQTKQWENLAVFNDHTAAVTDVKFGQNASYIASTGLDRALKLYEYRE